MQVISSAYLWLIVVLAHINTWFIVYLKWLAEYCEPLKLLLEWVTFVTAVIAVAVAYRTYLSEKDTARKTLQAYVGVESISLSSMPDLGNSQYTPEPPEPGQLPANFLTLKITNFGQTPARHVTVSTAWLPMPLGHALPSDFEYTVAKDEINDRVQSRLLKTQLFPSETYLSSIPVWDVTPFSDAATKKTGLFLWGEVDYIDIYNQRWRTTFCRVFQYRLNVSIPFVPYHNHNDTKRIS